ncbi:MAG: NADH-quinone oxidoreductase subunit NuoG [Actinobacteria bacterium]|nr:NADH-quinone oxidoreductase subunit NuoG [Actinomycetota bacterium]
MADAKAEFSFTLDGREVTAREGEMLIAAAERAGTYIPRFCYHPRMEPVGVCRMCLVEVDGPRGATLQPSCYIEATEGMVVNTISEKVKKAQDGVLEFLLANHPLDCPVCDKGGECPLQDQTLAYGPGESRFVEEKRHFEKPIPISDLVLLDRERCIQCSRCTRFADEIAGEAQIDFAGRGELVEVATFPSEPFSSYFSGNTVQICPVGALTATPYRFAARPWDLDQVESTCTSCALGCRVAVQSSGNRVTRLLGVDSEAVNHGWLCDKGRFSFESTNGDEGEIARVTEAKSKIGDRLVASSWQDALATAATAIRNASASGFADSVALIGGANGSNESAYAWAKFMKGCLASDSVDAQLDDGFDAHLLTALPRATIADMASAKVVVTLTGDLREELPVLFLRLREAITKGSTALLELAPRATPLSALASASLSLRPGEELSTMKAILGDDAVAANLSAHPEGPAFSGEALATARALLAGNGEDVVFVVGRSSLATSSAYLEAAIQLIAERLPEARFLPALRRANVNGAIDMGLAPGLLPGRVDLEAGRSAFGEVWGAAPSSRGRSTGEILTALAANEPTAPRVLILLGADPLADFPDADLAARALANASFVIALSAHETLSAKAADVLFAITASHEESGTVTNIEGRVSTIAQKLVAPGFSWPAWMVAIELADALGHDLGFSTVEAITEEIAAVASAYHGISADALAQAAAIEGILAPMTDAVAAKVAGPLDPVAFPGLQALERIGLAAREGHVIPEASSLPPAFDSLTTVSMESGGSQLPTPTPDAYALRLVVSRRLYDGGLGVAASPSLAHLADEATIRLNPYDLERVGAGPDAKLRVRSAKNSLIMKASADAGVIRGTAEIPFNLSDGEIANVAASFITFGEAVTDLRLESL